MLQRALPARGFGLASLPCALAIARGSIEDSGVTITQATSSSDLALARELFREYANELNVDLCFQRFDEELKSLPGHYAPPDGRLYLAKIDGAVAGCVALRKNSDGIAEMKRLYVRPQLRRTGAGGALCRELISAAREIGYSAIVLDTLESLTPALRLYEALGFRRVAPYYANPLPHVVYMRLDLSNEL